MSRFSNTRSVLVERCAKLHLHDWKGGTATGGAVTTVVDATNRNESDDYFNNLPFAEVYIVTTTDGAAPIGQRRDITDFVQTSGTITVSDEFTVAPAAGDTYSIHAEYPRDEVVEAINAAIDDVADEALVDLIDEESIELVSAVYEYDIPSGFLYIYRLTMANDDGIFGEPIPPDHYKIIRGSSTPKIHFIQMPAEMQYTGHYYGELWANSDFAAERNIRVEGLGRQARLTKDTDICKVDPTYVCAQAAAYLHSNRIYRSDVDPDEHRTQATVQGDIATKGRARLITRLPPDCKAVER